MEAPASVVRSVFIQSNSEVASVTDPRAYPQIDLCDQEPVNFIGSIQPFGALLGFEERTGKLQFFSRNWREIFTGVENNSSLENFLGWESGMLTGANWTGRSYRSDDMIIVEAEPGGIKTDLRPEVEVLDALEKSGSLSELLGCMARGISQITKMNRVLVYKFHPDLHGEVMAEELNGKMESMLGLHYPASDIPAPARNLFLKSWVRIIPAVDYVPEPIIHCSGKDKQIDLGASILRAVSPIHLEYLRNMNVASSLTISLQSGGKLWGLIACHSANAHFISMEIRAACASIGRMGSAFISVKKEQDKVRRGEGYQTVQRQLVERMGHETDLGGDLTAFSPNLLDLISAAGGAAALYANGTWAGVGNYPCVTDLENLVDWLEQRLPKETLFATDELPSLYKSAEAFKDKGCGLLALHIPKTTRNYVLWFRPEFLQTVHWAGQPEKIQATTGRLHPRQSFTLWKEEVSGRSAPWSELDKRAAMDLRASIIAMDLQVQFRKEQRARAEAERAIEAREELMVVLSHDLKNPVGSIRMNSAMALRFAKTNTPHKVPELLERIERAASYMNGLIHDILSITKLESGLLALETKTEDLLSIVQEVVEILSPLSAEKAIEISVSFPDKKCTAEVDRGMLLQVFSNLIGNAIKFTPNHGKISVSLDKFGPEFLTFSISDNGPGIEPTHLLNIFDRFWQAQKTRKLGSGLGLAIAKGFVDAHGGSIHAESDGHSGTVFFFSLPIARPAKLVCR